VGGGRGGAAALQAKPRVGYVFKAPLKAI
jgi:hypothetical protein